MKNQHKGEIMCKVKKISKLKLGESLTYETLSVLKELETSLPEDCTGITINMRKTQYIDSSGLGLLLNLKHNIRERNIPIKLKNARPNIHKILLTAVFDRQFEIEPI